MTQSNTAGTFSLIWRIYSLAKSYSGLLLSSLLLTVAIAFLGPYRPYLMQQCIDTYMANKDAAGLVTISIWIGVLLVVQVVFQLLNTIISGIIGQNVLRDLRLKVYDKLIHSRIRFYDKTPVGTLVTRSVSDIETIADIFSEGLINIAGDLLQILFILILMFATDWRLSLVSLSVLPLLLYAGYVFKEKVRISFERVRNEVARLNTFVQEHIQGMHIVQLFNREHAELLKFKTINASHRDANIRSIFYYSVFFPVVEIIAAVSVGLIVWYGSLQIIDYQTSAGILVAFIMYVNMFFRPIRQIADRFNTLQMGMVAADRIFKLTDDAESTEQTTLTSYTVQKGKIDFRDVSFSYSNEHAVLDNISFTVPAGKTLAIVGETGSGKSTIVQLINRFYTHQSGSIHIDDIPVENYNLETLRKHIALVPQDVFLFSGSVLENIRLFNEHITEEQVKEAAIKTGADVFISKLPDGYKQQVFERGLSLSTGQRQLIAFTRAWLYNPEVLILDEATANIDYESEQLIQQATQVLMNNRTCIIIAHRLSTVVNADTIVVLKSGRIIEQGTHLDLIGRPTTYKDLFEKQFSSAPSPIENTPV
ncbi:MAG: ABC transporter ATP-binding protein [Bacteroidota bacterium]|jgi:ATP-binding cassette subfamily B multidrug efflux pump